MDRVGLAGLSLNETSVAGLEPLRRALDGPSGAFPRELADALAASELVLLLTCNRVEIAYARESGAPPGPGDREVLAKALALEGSPGADQLWVRSGERAVHHLLRVASSLDSLVVGEAQILGQVRGAFEEARALGLVGEVLGTVFGAAIQVGKQVRSETDLAHHSVSVVTLGVEHLVQRLAPLEHEARIALVGAGHMGELVVKALEPSGLRLSVIANRNPERARRLAPDGRTQVVDLETLFSGRLQLDGLITATGAPDTICRPEQLAGLCGDAGSLLVAVDLALPRDLPACDDARIERVDLDRLRGRAAENRARRLRAAERAEELVLRKLGHLRGKLSRRDEASHLADSLAATADLFERELEHFLGGRMAHLGDPERRHIERWARTTFGRLSHGPLRALRELLQERQNDPGVSPQGGRS